MRPAILLEVAELAGAGESFDLCLANFLDGFYASPGVAALLPPPPMLAPTQACRARNLFVSEYALSRV